MMHTSDALAGEAKHATAESMIQAAVAANASQRDAFDDDIPMTFPQKLMQIVSDESTNDVVAWLPHGKGFQIYKKRKFASDVLPKAFKQSKYTSFTRKLNRWGFTRVTRGPETGAYYHKYFQRGNTRLCMQMSCQSGKVKASTSGDASVPSQQLLHQQFQQLQMHQFHLQQMQMQQHMQAEMFRQQQQQQQQNKDVKKDGDKPQDQGAAAFAAAPPMDQATYFQSMQAGGMMPFIPGLQPGVFPAMPIMPGVGAPFMPPPPQQQQQAPADDGTTTSNEESTAKVEEQV
mmetsp:Transcript_26426/g.47749  ORF Transcript_26426/g.47749 Transcript_26426/m.47749 type:complete len:288 (+) Transcript_26426:117-980(+)